MSKAGNLGRNGDNPSGSCLEGAQGGSVLQLMTSKTTTFTDVDGKLHGLRGYWQEPMM